MCRFGSVLLLSVVLVACADAPHALRPETAPPTARAYPVHVINHGWHTGIILASRHLPSSLAFLQQDFPAAAYLEFGWGDAEFYQADTVDSGLALRAILLPSDAVMFVRRLNRAPAELYPAQRLTTLKRSQAQLDSLTSFLANSFQYDAMGHDQATMYRAAAGGHFYPAQGKYTLFNTCNTWTAKALKSSGYAIDAESIITAGGLMEVLREKGTHP